MIHSKKYTDAARGQPCTLQIPGICNGNWETVVFAHIRDEFKGMGNKASDISGCDACSSCHAKFDGQLGEPLSRDEWLQYAIRGMQRTLENRFAQGILFVPADPKKRKSGRKVRSARKLPTRPMPNSGRKLGQRPYYNQRDIND